MNITKMKKEKIDRIAIEVSDKLNGSDTILSQAEVRLVDKVLRIGLAKIKD